ncbi:amidase [Fervidobacterium changbaicum]|nr:acetamidase/formamidase family protein [Fervidobacterium changbaicum]QAV33809.1 acetamidase [Fervidobacterium changbaicum]SDH67603.1 amidase [Fervidobacterium changbaicum]
MGNARHRISAEHRIYAFCSDVKPALFVESGDEVEFETLDCFSNQIRSCEDKLENLNWSEVNPATGPVFVNGSMPGDVLEIEIIDIEVAERGVMVTGKGLGPLGERFEEYFTKIVEIKDGKAIFNGLKLPIEPMIGVIGVAPKEGCVNCGTPGYHGGNLDTKYIKKGAKVLLPVSVEGALLALGDLHALMGDGEICGTGIEVPGKVVAKVRVRKGLKLKNPMVICEEGVFALASAQSLDEAVKCAVENMAEVITSYSEIPLEELVMLMSIVGDTQISQIVDPLVTARFRMPVNVLRQLGIDVF